MKTFTTLGLIILGVVFFLVAFVDLLLTDGQIYSDLSWIGKTAVWCFTGIIGFWTAAYIVHLIRRW